MNRGRARGLLVFLFLSCGDKTPPSMISSPPDASSDRPAGDGSVGDLRQGDAATVVVSAECERRACNASVADLCCPSACSGATDVDCAGCGNGRMEPGELCDPADRCPTGCPQLKCEKQRLKSGGTCAAVCVSAGTQTACADGDECCPEGCTAATDRDCAARCDNGAIEAGELCDPLSSCPQSCPMQGCTMLRLEGAGTCLARCVQAGVETACRSDDGCCPAGCTAANDSDCAVTCDNGVIEGKEICDPLATCPKECPSQGCRLRRLINGGTCNAACIDDALQSTCQNGDGCCPVGCNATNDGDCSVLCGNGAVESGETCDPIASCTDQERACVSDATTTRTRTGDAGKCSFLCVEMTRACGAIDRACPPGCGPADDPDCAGCGNAVVEPGETCDPPAACEQVLRGCVSDDSTVRTPSGNPQACTASCAETPRACGAADGFCPAGCSAARDRDCVGCGNGMLDPGETCDPVAVCNARSVACVSDANVVRTRAGDPATCRFTCQEAPRVCGAADGQCPAECGPAQDRDCPGCGNGRVETGETCDPCTAADVRACAGDSNVVRVPGGDPTRCTFVCTSTPRACMNGDGFCPDACTRANDLDCLAGPGDPCMTTSECASGSCVDGRCCVQSCLVCQSCTGAQGTCVNITKGEADNVPAMACAGGAICDGTGKCVQPVCQLRVQPAMLAFDLVAVGSSSRALPVTVTNACATAVPQPVITSSSGEFPIATTTCQGNLAPNASCIVNVIFAPRVAGLRTGTLSVGLPGAAAGLTVALTGTGAAFESLLFEPPGLDFGVQQVGGTATAPIVLRNAGATPSGPLTLAIDGNQYRVGKTTCTELPARGTCTIETFFNPLQTGGVLGTLSATALSGASASTSLKGTGITSSAIVITPPSHAFARATSTTFRVSSTTQLTGVSINVVGTNAVDFVITGLDCPANGTLGPNVACVVNVLFQPQTTARETAQLRAIGVETVGTVRRTYSATAALESAPIIIIQPGPVVLPPVIVGPAAISAPGQ